jgi:hypothetical protein
MLLLVSEILTRTGLRIRSTWRTWSSACESKKRNDDDMDRDGVIIKASKLNRGLLVLILCLLVYILVDVINVGADLSDVSIAAAEQKAAVDQNTQQLVDFMHAWNDDKQMISNWITQSNQALDLLRQKNPKVRVPLPPPPPPNFPKGQPIDVKQLTAPSPSVSPKVKSESSSSSRHRAPRRRKTLWERIFPSYKNPRATR